MPWLASSRFAGPVCAVALVAAASGCHDKRAGEDAQPSAQPAETTAATTGAPPFDSSQLALFAPLPAKLELPENPLTDDKVALGRQLYFDKRLSRGQDVSCNSCHDVSKNGADRGAHSTGTHGRVTEYNTPTVFNAAGGFGQGWDTRATMVEDFVVPHMLQPSVMGMPDEKHVVDVVASIPAYAAAFKRVYPSEKAITAEQVAKTLGAYTRKLVTPAPWDRFLLGDDSALTRAQRAGLGVFLDAGCSGCHAGKYMGASQNQKLGLAKPWPGDAGADLGRYVVTKQEIDKGVFKVPSLRNVTKTAPYLHDGSVASLEQISELMSRHQLGRELDAARAAKIVTFLGALSGEPPRDLISKPSLPPSGPKTPKPE
jgi:cytochrome c peroxidase